MSSGTTEFTDEFVPIYSLSHLTLLDCSTPELAYIASRAGYDAISPRLMPMGVAGESPCSPLDNEMIRATRNALKVTGIEVHDIELACITDHCEVKSYEPAFEAGAELGASKVIASAWTNRRDDREYVIDTYAEICDLADRYELSVALEFPTFSRLRDLREAADIVQAAGRSNGGILIDTLYTHMSRVDLTELESLPSEWFSFIQVSDALPGVPDTRAGMIQIARDARLYPGEGYIDFAAIIDRLPPVNYCIELPNRSRLEELGCEEHARRCLQAAKRAFGILKSKRISGATGVLKNNPTREEFYGSRTH